MSVARSTGSRFSALLLGLAVSVSCSATPEPDADDTVEALGVPGCVLYVHGRTEVGAPAAVIDGRGVISPNGNSTFGDGFVWEYANESDYGDARKIVADAIARSECDSVVINGFSNGAAFAAKLFCRGETFGGVVTGYVLDDPVPDMAAVGCRPSGSTDVVLYWTGALADIAAAGVECASIGYTCDGDELLGIDAYSEALGTQTQPSPFDDHRRYENPPELDAWL